MPNEFYLPTLKITDSKISFLESWMKNFLLQGLWMKVDPLNDFKFEQSNEIGSSC